MPDRLHALPVFRTTLPSTEEFTKPPCPKQCQVGGKENCVNFRETMGSTFQVGSICLAASLCNFLAHDSFMYI